jgi:hypothetical protein
MICATHLVMALGLQLWDMATGKYWENNTMFMTIWFMQIAGTWQVTYLCDMSMAKNTCQN